MNQAEYGFDAAVMLMRAGRRDEAAAAAWEVVRQNPLHSDAWALRARIEADAGRYPNAMLHHGFALQASPHRHDLWVNRGIDAMNARMLKEAEQSFVQSLKLQESFEGHYNYANLLCSQMMVDGAVEHYRKALELDPSHSQARTNLGTALIGRGEWQEGFAYYRERFRSPGFPPRPRMNYPLWKGEPLKDKTILLFAEQGFGDEIMSLRFAHSVRQLGARVILAVRPPMFRLARQDGLEVIHLYDPPPVEPDYMCALLDVPGFLNLTPDTLPCRDGYLSADDRGFRLSFPPGYNVGVCWTSGKRDLQPHVAETARQKSLTFDQLVRPLARPGVNLVSLQQTHNDDAAMRELGVIDMMPGVTDFADTAWIVSQLDLVITVDTSVAHLAGALGKQVWNLVRFDALWPWMQEKGRTSWYSSMHLYRQERAYDWKEPLLRLREDFKAIVDRQAAA